MRPALQFRSLPLVAASAGALALSCGPSPGVVDRSALSPAASSASPTSSGAATDPGVARGPQTLQVAGSEPRERRRVEVDAKAPRTFIGRVEAGERVRVAVIESRWRHDPGEPFVTAKGVVDSPCLGGGAHRCVAGEGAAPMMGLILLVPSRSAGPACAEPNRLDMSKLHQQGIEFAMPADAFLFFAPNDRLDHLHDNSGSVRVSVEVTTSPSGGSAVFRGTREVDARSAGTLVGRFRAGQHVRVSVQGGKWSPGRGEALVDAGGVRGTMCSSGRERSCIGGEGAAPLMALTLLMAPCEGGIEASRGQFERRYIPNGADFVAERGGEMFLAPNDWDDGMFNNEGSAIVEVELGQR
jgi:hypothetical protein